MPYSVGAQGSNGCSGYPVVKEGGEVMGCHKTEADATAQAKAEGYSYWLRGLGVDGETVNRDTAELELQLKALWNGMEPEERSKLISEAAIIIK